MLNLELSFLTVFALPKASRTGFDCIYNTKLKKTRSIKNIYISTTFKKTILLLTSFHTMFFRQLYYAELIYHISKNVSLNSKGYLMKSEQLIWWNNKTNLNELFLNLDISNKTFSRYQVILTSYFQKLLKRKSLKDT